MALIVLFSSSPHNPRKIGRLQLERSRGRRPGHLLNGRGRVGRVPGAQVRPEDGRSDRIQGVGHFRSKQLDRRLKMLFSWCRKTWTNKETFYFLSLPSKEETTERS